MQPSDGYKPVKMQSTTKKTNLIKFSYENDYINRHFNS